MASGFNYHVACADEQPNVTIPLEASDEPVVVEDANVVSMERRTKNINVDEDKLLLSAWLNMSLYPIQGTDQSKSNYRSIIHQYFHANKTFDSNRSQVSLMKRWYGIQHDVNVFRGCVSRIESRNESCASIDDKVCQPLPPPTYSSGMHYVTRLLTLYENL
jgi:hypothetical protein